MAEDQGFLAKNALLTLTLAAPWVEDLKSTADGLGCAFTLACFGIESLIVGTA